MGGFIYSRYIQNPDGGFERRQVTERKPEPLRPEPETPPEAASCPPEPPPAKPCRKSPELGRLLQRLGRRLDTGDLLILLILLLICVDSKEDSGVILLTIAFFLFL